MSTILPITDNMIVDNKLIMMPSISYISSSLESKTFEEYNLSSHGVVGNINSDAKGLKKNYRSTINNVASREYQVNVKTLEEFKSSNNKNLIEILEEANDISDLNSKGIYKNNTHLHNFEIEKIKERFITNDNNFFKKKSIINLFDFYKRNPRYESANNLLWGFSNYNTLNFFSLGNKKSENNDGISNNLTHKNNLLYPNIINDEGKQAYDFSGNEISLSFFLNPRYTNKKDYHFNPGCIVFIPGVFSIYLVQGTNTDSYNNVNSYRFFIELFDFSYNSFDSNFSIYDQNTNPLGFDITDPNSQFREDALFLLKDENKINTNKWYNVTVSLKRIDFDNFILKICLNGEEYETFEIVSSFSYSFPSHSSFISIGNKPVVNSQAQVSQNFIDYAFSLDKQSQNDTNGPYITKFFNMGKTFNSSIDFPPNPVIEYVYANQLEPSTGDYITSDTSLGLHAEIHDIRLYNKFVDLDKAKEIFKHGIENLANEKEKGLIFYLPVYFYPQEIKKKGIVNLYLENDKIYENNIASNSVNNIHFENFAGGYEIYPENFLRDFVDNTTPNIVIGGNINENIYSNIFNFKDLNTLNAEKVNNLIKKGKSPNEILDILLFNLKNSDNVSKASDFGDNFYQLNAASFINNMILPNDNGYQKQYYNDNIFTDITTENKQKYFINKLTNITSYQNVSLLNNLDTLSIKDPERSKRLYKSQNYNISVLNGDVLNGSEMKFEDIENSLDKVYDISLIAYHIKDEVNDQGVYPFSYNYQNGNDALIYSNYLNNRSSNISLNIDDTNSFFKTYSNPSSRRIGTSYKNNISSELIYFKSLARNDESISYKKYKLPLYDVRLEEIEFHSPIFCISTQIFNKKIKKGSLEIEDKNLGGTLGGVDIKLSSNFYGGIYRSDCLSPHAKWNQVGNVLNNEGIVTVLHPGIENFGRNNFGFKFQSFGEHMTKELNLKVSARDINASRNKTFIDGLKIDDSSFNLDENFVYISDVNLHDENFNIIAKAKLTQPIPKKDSDNYLIRLKMDF